MNKNVRKEYIERVQYLSKELKEKESTASMISYFRLLIVIVTVLLIIFFTKSDNDVLIYPSLLIGLSVFIFLVTKHTKLFQRIEQLQRLISINKKGIDRIDDKWCTFHDIGNEFIDEGHRNSFDLDVFGQSSIFQFINTSHTYHGRQRLASKLRNGSSDINNTQQAVTELSKKIDFRQNFEASALKIKDNNPTKIIDWFKNSTPRIIPYKLELIIKTLPYISFTTLIIDALIYQTVVLPLALYSIQTIIFLSFYKKSINLFTILDNKIISLQAYSKLFKLIESEQFESDLINNLQSRLLNNNSISSSLALMSLNNILQRSDLRYNQMVHFLVNIFSLWDVNCAISATKWKISYGQFIPKWFDVTSEIEALSSLAILSFENPSWNMPNVNDSMAVNAHNIMHPLISNKNNIGNDFILNDTNRIAIISGSNMSGKSTFLRTIATNLLLAYAGAPVCAESLSCGRFDIITSMRTKDNVSKNISTFYSELLRIKAMLNSISINKTFFLIDEIFSGTNSKDRIDGALIVLKQLNQHNSLGMISTHDLELCSLEKDKEQPFSNHHFREHYIDDKIKFDYKIYPGPSKTSNAIFIMRMIGIPTESIRLPASNAREKSR
ncbi:hypothetical protein L4D76_12285 [Photobacterium sagamiensis]|uniref:MutS-related protein n=1 Tax=Photobacterium sagamiensis TaxID=2910241 RepID=UPI003D0B2E01